MDAALHLHHLRTDSAALLAAHQADPTAPVPTCPGWDRTTLLGHVAGVHGWVRTQLAAGPDERIRMSAVKAPTAADELADFYEAGMTELLERLAGMDLDTTWPTWAGPQPGTFFPRRMAQETAVHRRDADPAPYDPDLAVDGVDELLELMAPRIPAERLDGATGTIHLHATDTEGEWLVQLTSEGIRFERGHAKGDVALRGPAGDLLLWAWNRQPLDERLEVFGDPSLVELWGRVVVL